MMAQAAPSRSNRSLTARKLAWSGKTTTSKSFRNLLMVMMTAVLLVFVVLLIEFRSFMKAISIVIGAVLVRRGFEVVGVQRKPFLAGVLLAGEGGADRQPDRAQRGSILGGPHNVRRGERAPPRPKHGPVGTAHVELCW